MLFSMMMAVWVKTFKKVQKKRQNNSVVCSFNHLESVVSCLKWLIFVNKHLNQTIMNGIQWQRTDVLR